ncbi:SLATT domain-containing protein [Novosphingobium sp. fls2-241-R2A-195]|uniref:SLATT domain-containing protein n=1 Tax=Novosphingobium sp. fls2-241-R2A-195 TaxID=3040296 RepID=UPI00254E943D|nr:SLATT domain-containing protein [Novosphingobium sp. fls2-241-R2A-195]
MSSEIEYYKNLINIMQKTSGTRFSAANNLTVRDRFSVATLSILSIFLIAISVISLVSSDAFGSDGAKFFGALSVIASVWILVITLFDYALSRSVLALRLHQNAIRINQRMRAMEREVAKPMPDMEALRNWATDYENDIADTEVNHSPSDYKIYLFSKQKPTGWITKIWYPVRNFTFSALVFCISVPSNILVLLVVIGATAWYVFAHQV